MRKKKLSLFLFCILFIFCGCNKGQKDSPLLTRAPMTTSAAQTVSAEDFSHIEKHVVWYHDGQFTYGRDPRIFTEFNNLLLERGYDFVVDFVTEPSLSEEEYYAYQQKLRTCKEQGQQVDLIFTGWAMVEGETTYDSAIRDELLLPLDEFFAESEEGKKLYEVFPAHVWEMMERDGKVYGVCENGWYGNYYSAVLNKTMLEKYEVEAPGEFSLEGYFQTIRQVYEKAKAEGEELFPLYLTADAVYSYLGYYKAGDFWVKQTEDGRVAFVNPYEDGEAKKLFALLEEYHEAFGGYGTTDEYRNSLRANVQIASFQPTLMHCSCSNKNIDYPAYTYEPQQIYYAMPIHNAVHGVASWATYPEEAKTLLTLISTDEEFINLLYYGIEDVNYRLEDGLAVLLNEKKREAPGFEARVNELFVYSRFSEPLNKRELLQEHQQKVVFLPLEVEELQKEPLSEEEAAVAALFRKAEGLWLGEYENAGEVAEQICEELKAAKVEEVLQKRTERIYRKEE